MNCSYKLKPRAVGPIILKSPFFLAQNFTRFADVRVFCVCIFAECLYTSRPIPVAFCYVPSLHQMERYLNKNMKTIQQSSSVITSPVDQKICFFGPEDACKETGSCDSYGISPDKSIWRHLQEDKLWLTVLEYYYSLCNVPPEKRRQAMNVYIRKRNKHHSGGKESKKYPSYAELSRKLGIVKENQIDSKEIENEKK